MSDTFAKRLEQLVRNSGLSYKTIETKTQIPASTIANWIAGTKPQGPFEPLETLANVLGSDPMYLLLGKQPVKPLTLNQVLQDDGETIKGLFEVEIRPVKLRD
tara:strand:+ start:371 stop:679 length:309 start_codon:yes stop_codon:yes gene_type:complete